MVRFGPSGYCEKFLENNSHSEQVPAFIENFGLDAFEYPFNKGVRITDAKALSIGRAFEGRDILLSVHGPYYINLANPDDEMAKKSLGYILDSLKKMKLMGSKYLVIHPGSLMKNSREVALELAEKRMRELSQLLDENGFEDVYICPETMGKHGQLGTVEEVAKLCALDKRFIPTLDFGHINAFTLGGLKTEEDFENVFKTLEKHMGKRYKKVHIHFSKIEYGPKGELRHLTFAEDPGFGPDFELLAKVLKKLDIDATLICESRGTQSEDAHKMKEIFQKELR